jgi:uncharacterized membrane protein
MRRRKRSASPAFEEKVISKSDRMKRLVACCGIAGFLLACLAALLNYHHYFQAWQVRLLGWILIGSIVIVLGYGSVWVWIVNPYKNSE